MNSHPYGHCACPDESYQHAPGECNGPAAYEVTRNDAVFKACTRCFSKSDERRLLPKPEDDGSSFEVFMKYDALGVMMIMKDMEEKKGLLD